MVCVQSVSTSRVSCDSSKLVEVEHDAVLVFYGTQVMQYVMCIKNPAPVVFCRNSYSVNIMMHINCPVNRNGLQQCAASCMAVSCST